MKKSIISLGIIIMLLVWMLPVVEALATSKTITVIIDGELKDLQQAPVIKNARTLVPLRGIFESLGARVEYDSKTRKIVAKNNDFLIELVIGDVYVLINKQRVKLEQRAEVINGSTMVPLRFISESLGAQVHWDGGRRIVTIRYATISANEKLLLAIRENNSEAVEMLLKEGADANTVSAHNEKALELAIRNGTESLVSLLLEYGANPNQALQSGLPLLVMTVDKRNIEMTQALLEAGANPNAQFRYRNYIRTAMNSASSEIREFSVEKYSELVELLIKYGAVPPLDWPWKDQEQVQQQKQEQVQQQKQEQEQELALTVEQAEGLNDDYRQSLSSLTTFSIPKGEAIDNWGVYKLNEYTGKWELVPSYAIDGQSLQVHTDVWKYEVRKLTDFVPSHMKKSWAIREFNLFANMKAIHLTNEYKHKDRITLDEIQSIFRKISTKQIYEQIVSTIEMNNLNKQHISKQELVVLANHLLREQIAEYNKNEGLIEEKYQITLNEDLELLYTFVDKDDIYYHYEKELAIAVNYQLITGHTGHFLSPSHLLTREEAVSLLARYSSFYWKVNEWY